MTTLSLTPQYINVLKALGSIEENVEEVIRHYIIEKIGERIGRLQHEISIFQHKFNCLMKNFMLISPRMRNMSISSGNHIQPGNEILMPGNSM